MARKTSPFAELTNDQKQLKWLEYQSIRLPYTEAGPMPPEAEYQTAANPVQTEQTSAPSPAETPKAQPAAGHTRPLPPPEVYVRMQQQKTRHHQYDAVIARMKQAEMRTGSYHSWSK